MRRYLLYIWSDVEPDVLGPCRTEAERDKTARQLRKDDPEGRNGIFMLDVSTRGIPKARAYRAGFFERQGEDRSANGQ